MTTFHEPPFHLHEENKNEYSLRETCKDKYSTIKVAIVPVTKCDVGLYNDLINLGISCNLGERLWFLASFDSSP